jgi:hypothetical protein
MSSSCPVPTKVADVSAQATKRRLAVARKMHHTADVRPQRSGAEQATSTTVDGPQHWGAPQESPRLRQPRLRERVQHS